MVGDDFGKHAGFGCGDFDGDLVGLQLHKGLVLLHGVAGLLHPLGDGSFADAFAESWHNNVGHFISLRCWRRIVTGQDG